MRFRIEYQQIVDGVRYVEADTQAEAEKIAENIENLGDDIPLEEVEESRIEILSVSDVAAKEGEV